MRLFGLGGGGNAETDAAKALRDENERRLAQGGLTRGAESRLQEQAARQGTPDHLFGSDLSVPEFALLRQAGFEPLGQVLGSSVYHVGWQWMPAWSGTSSELTVLTQAYYEARSLAIGRLKQEAALLRATGVVGVRLDRRAYDWGTDLLEFAAVGTAIRETDVAPDAAREPWVSDLSGDDFWRLRCAGFRPVGFAFGNCTYYQVPTWNTQYVTAGVFGGGWVNQELPDYTQALYTARALAMERMAAEARAVNAAGVIGADVEVQAERREVEQANSRRIDMIYHFTALGTAISPYEKPPPTAPFLTAVSLTDDNDISGG